MRLVTAFAPVLLSLGSASAQAAGPTPSNSLIGPVMRVSDPEREMAFYQAAFGVTLAMTLDAGKNREYMLRFGSDMQQPGIVLISEHDPAERHGVEQGDGWSRLVVRTNEIEAIAARLDTAGYPHEPIRDVAHGYRMMIAQTPDGYRLEIVQSAANKEQK